MIKKIDDEKDIDAIFDLASKYHTGDGVEQDYEKAIELYESIADKDSVAAHNLALIYCGAYGENKEYFNKGISLFIENSEKSYGPSCAELMKLMILGFNIEQTHSGALYYLQKCIEIKHYKAIDDYYRVVAIASNIGLNIDDAIRVLEPDSARAISVEKQIIKDRTPPSASWRIKGQALLEHNGRKIDEIEVEFDNDDPEVTYYFDISNAFSGDE